MPLKITYRDYEVNTKRVRKISRVVNNEGMTFSENLRRLRKSHGMTQEQLALTCGWGQSRIANYESRGSSAREPSFNDIEIISRVLGVTKAELLGETVPGVVSETIQAPLAERLRIAMIEAGMTQKQLADAVGVKPPSIHGWLSSKAKFLRGENLLKAAKALNVSEKWLATGTGLMRAVTAIPAQETPLRQESQHINLDTYEFQAIDDGEALDPEANVLVDEVDVMLSAGNGVLIPEFIETKFQMPFPLPWLRHAHINPKDVKLMRVHGDSMERTLFDKDRVMVNFADTRVRDGKVYAIAIGGEAKVKRLYTLRNNGLRIVSDNQNKDSEGHRIYKDEIVPPSEMETVQVLGRVIDRGGSGGL